MLDDDREPALDTWFIWRAADLPELMAAEFRIWFDVLRDGSLTTHRSRPRGEASIRVHIARAAPMLHGWAGAGGQSLREITRQDLADALSTRAAQQRHALVAMHSLFRMLKGRRVIFASPASRLRCAPQNPGSPLLLTVDVRDAVHGGQAGRAALAALIAFNALRAGQLASLKLTNIRDGRLGLPVRDIPLAPPVRDLLAAWLDVRGRRWPGTTNPYLFSN